MSLQEYLSTIYKSTYVPTEVYCYKVWGDEPRLWIYYAHGQKALLKDPANKKYCRRISISRSLMEHIVNFDEADSFEISIWCSEMSGCFEARIGDIRISHLDGGTNFKEYAKQVFTKDQLKGWVGGIQRC